MRKYIIDEETLKGILSYLSSRPWSEVQQGMSVLQSLPLLEDEKETEKPEDAKS